MDDESTKKSGKKTDRQTFGLMFVFAIGILIGFAIMASLSIPLASWSAQSSLPPATSGSAPENPNSPENAKEREALTSDATVRGIISKVVEELSARTETTSKLTEATYVHIKELFGIAGLVISIFAAVNIWSAFEARNSLDKYKKEIEDLIEKEKNDAHQKFSNLLALQTEQQLLVRQVADLEEPFVRHELHAREQQIIDQYLQKLEELRNNPGDDALSFYDFEQAGYANHFLATTNSGFNKEEQRRRDREAVTYYKLALQKYDPKSEKIMDRRSCSINRQLGNAQVGLGEYASALNLYQGLINLVPSRKRYCI